MSLDADSTYDKHMKSLKPLPTKQVKHEPEWQKSWVLQLLVNFEDSAWILYIYQFIFFGL